MRLFDGLLTLFSVLCAIAESVGTSGAGGPKQAGDLTGGGEGSARRMGGWTAGRVRADGGSLGTEGVSPSGLPGYRPFNRLATETDVTKSSWKRLRVCLNLFLHDHMQITLLTCIYN